MGKLSMLDGMENKTLIVEQARAQQGLQYAVSALEVGDWMRVQPASLYGSLHGILLAPADGRAVCLPLLCCCGMAFQF